MSEKNLDRRLNRIMEAVEAQARDETLWDTSSIAEAYAFQSLRWLHELIENDSDVALNNIVNQSKGDI